MAQTMHAALIDNFNTSPRYGEIDQPQPGEGEVLVRVRAAALSNLVRGQASGSHYSSVAQFPFTPGNDGVGELPDGSRVYFISPRTGSMAEWSVVQSRRTIAIPESLDSVTAAALGNPGIATWGALLGRAKLERGESVLINGATGIAGKQAIQVAKYLGASRVIATGRNATALESLRQLGADELIPLTGSDDELKDRFRETLKTGVNVVLDYLWGPSALALLNACAGSGSPGGEPRIRYIQIGSISGQTIDLPAAILRSSGVELLGSGLGSLPASEILRALTTMYAAAATENFAIETEAVPLAEVAAAWASDSGDRRIVFTP